ncbi:AAA family ATPase [Curtobacterium sp. MCLR17_058]|uniref:AAA family ATPase n=1 Tax=Curtobacterium sp. MCLR17_058 TaxID=2175635 RepID=UPI000DA905E8|nr:AAA family ATPase [Curtobacterium sp. MCLR17_058]WIB42154.1 AAA family ATPase [Curtobacterium sp. MCLR17_058]
MTAQFRLRSVTAFGKTMPPLSVQIGAADEERGNAFTAITGKNGVGKSRLLSAAAAAFEGLSSGRSRRGVSAAVEFEVDGILVEAEISRGQITYNPSIANFGSSKAPGPTRVIATTASAFDKFDIPRISEARNIRQELTNYRYLGLKDSRGRISATAGLYRALENIFDGLSADNYRRSAISGVFADLGYQPRVEVLYSWTHAGEEFLTEGVAAGIPGYVAFDNRPESKFRVNPGSSLDMNGRLLVLEEAASLAAEVEDRGKLRLHADFVDHTASSRIQHLRAAQQLRRAGLIRIESVNLFRDGSSEPVDVQYASSGEMSLVTTMLGIASSIDDASLVLIDEPEISLHPELQSQYIPRLRSVFRNFDGCHFVVATHSPLIIAGMPDRQSQVISLESTNVRIPERATDGARLEMDQTERFERSTDAVLLNTFNVAGPDNLYLKQTLVRALRIATKGDLASEEFSYLSSVLNDALTASALSLNLRRVIEDLNKTVDRVRGVQ